MHTKHGSRRGHPNDLENKLSQTTPREHTENTENTQRGVDNIKLWLLYKGVPGLSVNAPQLFHGCSVGVSGLCSASSLFCAADLSLRARVLRCISFAWSSCVFARYLHNDLEGISLKITLNFYWDSSQSHRTWDNESLNIWQNIAPKTLRKQRFKITNMATQITTKPIKNQSKMMPKWSQKGSQIEARISCHAVERPRSLLEWKNEVLLRFRH